MGLPRWISERPALALTAVALGVAACGVANVRAQDSHIGGSQASHSRVVPPAGSAPVAGKGTAKPHSGAASGTAKADGGSAPGTATVAGSGTATVRVSGNHAAARAGGGAGGARAGLASAAHGEPDIQNVPSDPNLPVELSDRAFAALIVHRTSAAYPALARSVHSRGAVVVDLTVDANGHPESADSIGAEDFGDAAIDAVRTWTFRPYLYQGQPRSVKGSIRFEFLHPEKGTSE